MTAKAHIAAKKTGFNKSLLGPFSQTADVSSIGYCNGI